MTTFIINTTPFCHKWQRVNHWEIVISSTYSEPEASPLSSSPPSEDFSEGSVSENEQNHQGMTDGEQCVQSWGSFDTSHSKDGQENYQNKHTYAKADPRWQQEIPPL